MPIYEYKCNQCGSYSEILHKTSKVTTVTCPQCQSNEMEKLISAPGALITKGGSSDAPPPCPNRNRCGAQGCPASGM